MDEKEEHIKQEKTIQKEIIKKINVEQNKELVNVDVKYVDVNKFYYIFLNIIKY